MVATGAIVGASCGSTGFGGTAASSGRVGRSGSPGVADLGSTVSSSRAMANRQDGQRPWGASLDIMLPHFAQDRVFGHLIALVVQDLDRDTAHAGTLFGTPYFYSEAKFAIGDGKVPILSEPAAREQGPDLVIKRPRPAVGRFTSHLHWLSTARSRRRAGCRL